LEEKRQGGLDGVSFKDSKAHGRDRTIEDAFGTFTLNPDSSLLRTSRWLQFRRGRFPFWLQIRRRARVKIPRPTPV